jgi:hypothetical protein
MSLPLVFGCAISVIIFNFDQLKTVLNVCIRQKLQTDCGIEREMLTACSVETVPCNSIALVTVEKLLEFFL